VGPVTGLDAVVKINNSIILPELNHGRPARGLFFTLTELSRLLLSNS
jgi:hypothetical protein